MADSKAVTLSLGNFTFQELEIPEVIPFHSSQKLAIKRMVGGVRQIDAMGIDPKPITWSGYFFPTRQGESALQRAQKVAAIRDAGRPVDLQWDVLHYQVFISDFNPDYRFARIPYSITLEVLADKTLPITTTQKPTADQAIGNDLVTVNYLTAVIADAQLVMLVVALAQALATYSSAIKAQNAARVTSANTTGTTSAGISLVNAPPSVVNSILLALQAAQARATVLIAQTDATLAATPGPGGMVAGASLAANLSSFSALLAANNLQVSLLQLQFLLGRIEANLEQINSSTRTITVSGGNLYDIAAQQYGDPSGAVLIMLANGLNDPMITGNMTLIIPPYNASAVNGGVLSA